MKKITQKKLNQILQQHQLWLDSNEAEGKCADLQDANLRYTNLRGTDLRSANLQEADLQGANLRYTNLRGAYLVDAYLIDADLRGARFSTNIRDCSSFSYAKFTPDTLPWLILHPGWPKWKDTVQIETE